MDLFFLKIYTLINKKLMKQKGFTSLIILIGILILAVLSGFYFWNKFWIKLDNKLPVPIKVPLKALAFPTSTTTPSPWKTYVNEKYGFQITYPKEGVILTEKGYVEEECGGAIKESKPGIIDVDNFFQVKIIDWQETIQDYLVSQRAGDIYETEKIEGSGADEGIYLIGLKKDFTVAVGYPPLLYVKYLFKKGNNIYIVSTFLHPENLEGCINPEVIDPSKYARYINPGWNPKNSFKFY